MHVELRIAGCEGENISTPVPARMEEDNVGYVDSGGTSTMIFACGDILLIACST